MRDGDGMATNHRPRKAFESTMIEWEKNIIQNANQNSM